MREQWRKLGSVAAVAALGLTACGDDAGDGGAVAAAASVTVTDAWSRQPADGQAVTAVYGVVSNPTDHDITVIAASTPVTDHVELHETVAGDDGKMAMREVPDGFVVPAGGEFVFESGGPHVMLFEIDAATYPDTVRVTLTFDGADPVTFDAEVRELPGSSMEHDGMDGDGVEHDGMDGDGMEHDGMDGDGMDGDSGA